MRVLGRVERGQRGRALHDLGGDRVVGAVVAVAQVLVGERVVGVVGPLVAVRALLEGEREGRSKPTKN